tara:strand:+ start:282 stop:869 length:588 start_codon:yes stop_codon:yes gene_type:complete
MSLWSNNDAVPGLATARYTVAANANADGTCTVTGTGSSFGLDGCAGIGTVIRFGADARGRTINVGAGHTYFGDAVIVAVASSESITIASTVGLSQVGFTTSARFSGCTKSPILDTVYQEKGVTDRDSVVYGISTTTSGDYHVAHQGWVGVTTYVDTHGTLRVKSEVLVAMSGITTTKDAINSTPSIPYPTTDRNS